MDSSNADPWDGFTGQSQADADVALITDPLVRQISELRAALGDSEARRAELEAVIDTAKTILQVTLDDNLAAKKSFHALGESPSVVLEDRDRENRAIGWDEARERFTGDNLSQGCACLDAEHRREHPARHWRNPYRGDTNA